MFLWLCLRVLVLSLTFDIGSMSDSDFFSDTEGSSALFVDDEELNNEDECYVIWYASERGITMHDNGICEYAVTV